MKINPKFLPIKGHYFFFMGSVSPILPFFIVILRQLGIPVLYTGTIGAAVLFLTVLCKPLIGAVADAFPRARKAIFIFILTLMVSNLCGIWFLPPMHGKDTIILDGNLDTSSSAQATKYDLDFQMNTTSTVYFHANQELCSIQIAWDCSLGCKECEDNSTFLVSKILRIGSFGNMLYSNSSPNVVSYRIENPSDFQSLYGDSVRLECSGGIYEGDDCPSLAIVPAFWFYLILYTIGQVSFMTANSISDAVTMDLIETEKDFGDKRAWGTVGWGLMGPISGALIDYFSGGNVMKDYTPAFAILFLFGSIDILLTTLKLKVPHFEGGIGALKQVGVLLKQPRFAVFLLFVILSGSFDGCVASYIFVLQEEMAEGTWLMLHIKFIQGLTIGIQCLVEAPFMWMCGWFLSRLGAYRLMSLVLFLYMFRLLSLALVGSYGPVWATLLTEVLNGPCYGLGYTAIVVQAGLVTPEGTSTTVQSIVNICYESLGYALASFLGGLMFTKYGGPGVYYIFASISVVTFLLHIISGFWFSTDEKVKKRTNTEDEIVSGEKSEMITNNTNQII